MNGDPDKKMWIKQVAKLRELGENELADRFERTWKVSYNGPDRFWICIDESVYSEVYAKVGLCQ